MYHNEFSKNSYEKMLNVFFILFVMSKNLLKCQKKLVLIQRTIEHSKLNKILNLDLLNFLKTIYRINHRRLNHKITILTRVTLNS